MREMVMKWLISFNIDGEMGFLILRLTHKREIMFDINEKDLLDLTSVRCFNG